MNVDVVKIREYLDNKESNIFNKVFVYSVVIGILLVFVICLTSLMRKEMFYKGTLIIEKGEIILYVNYNDVSNVIDNDKLYINNKQYRYNILDISLIKDKNIYYRIELMVNLGVYKINNNFLEYKILINEESILQYIVRMIKGG